MIYMPQAFHRYNRGMGGVDLVDRSLSNCRPSMHGKKWYYPLIVNAVNLATVATRRLSQYFCAKPTAQIEVLKESINSLLLKKTAKITAVKMPESTVNHCITPSLTRRRCKHCKKQARMKVPLHIHCFNLYHQ